MFHHDFQSLNVYSEFFDWIRTQLKQKEPRYSGLLKCVIIEFYSITRLSVLVSFVFSVDPF